MSVVRPTGTEERLARLRDEHDAWRRALILEPRGSEVLVGAWLCAPREPGEDWGVIFFNNVGYLGMCGHGTIGVVATLRHLGLITPGLLRLATPVGPVQATLHEDGAVTVANVPSYRLARQVAVTLNDGQTVHGDIAWGGNWFVLCSDHGQPLVPERTQALTTYALQIRAALQQAGITGADGAEIDHIELLGPPADTANDGRNFVLCPGAAYDRSPCGTGTSAKIACLAADGKLAPGETWQQASVIGSRFEASYTLDNGQVIPTIRGRAHVCAESTLLVAKDDPFGWGITLG